MAKLPNESLSECAATYKERNAIYKDNFLRIGRALAAMFGPDGVNLRTEDDYNRFNLLCQTISKLSRYIPNFASGGHPDSLHDLSVYAAMLNYVDELSKEKGVEEVEEIVDGMGPVSKSEFYPSKAIWY